MNRLRQLIGLLIAVVAMSWLDPRATAFNQTQLGGYSFEQVTSTNQAIEFLSSPKLSDDDAIAYRAFNFDSSSAIYFSDGGAPQKVIGSDYAYAGGSFDLIYAHIDMNNHHVIAFSTGYVGPAVAPRFGVFTVTPQGALVRVSTDKDPTVYFNSLGVSINDVGNVVYLRNASSFEDMYATTPVGPVRIFRGGDYETDPSIPEINNNGVVVFSGSGLADGVFTYSNGQVHQLDTAQGSNDIGKPGLNDHGQIVYTREKASFVNDLVLLENGVANVLPITGVIESRVEINDAGLIGFYGFNSHGVAGIRTYFEGQVGDVLGFGDAIFGKQVTTVAVWDINEKNQLALTVDFQDGSSAVVIATPVPEVTCGYLTTMALIIALPARVRRKRQ
jgi:hypothetical protein